MGISATLKRAPLCRPAPNHKECPAHHLHTQPFGADHALPLPDNEKQEARNKP